MVGLSAPYAAWYVPPHVLDSLNLYVRLFEFFAGPYFAVKHILLAITGADLSKHIGPIFRAAFLVGVLVIYVIDARRGWRIERSMLWIFGGFLALSTTVHPWYLIGLLPIVCFRLHGSTRFSASSVAKRIPLRLVPLLGWLGLSVIAPATYGYYVGLPYWAWVWIGWGGAALIAFYPVAKDPGRLRRKLRSWLSDVQRRRSVKKAARVRPWLPAHSSARASVSTLQSSPTLGAHRATAACMWERPVQVLDLGAGEGFVGHAIACAEPYGYDSQSLSGLPRYDVHLCDVADLNRTQLPHDVYDGETLPYEDGRFDAVVLYFVLHHCERPERVLSEALRVAAQRVVVVESVVTGPIQHRVLRATDMAVNRIREGGSLKGQEQYLSFRTAEAWRALAEEKGAIVEDMTTWAGWIHPQVRLVLEPAP
jgi:SAM-dependent methyltransferase